MSGRKLAANVVVGGVTYAAGSVPPPEVAEKISNPKAWASEPRTNEADEPKKAPAHKSAQSTK